MNEKDIERKFNDLFERALPKILHNGNNSVRDGVILDVDINLGAATVQLIGTSEVLIGVPYTSNSTPMPGMQCLILSSDPTLKNRVYAVVLSGPAKTTGLVASQSSVIDGLIKVSVANNDLTVELLNNITGTPSPKFPVNATIGGFFRQAIGSASITLADGTNYFNSGSSELATNSVQYYVYAVWNTAPNIPRLDIIVSRFGGAITYASFSSTNTNEKYGAFTNGTAPNATDTVMIIARFDATLSATAAFTWSITGTGNVQMSSSTDTDFMVWTPTLTGFSANPTNVIYIYRMLGNICEPTFVQVTDGTSNATTFKLSLPFTCLTLTNYQVIYPTGAVNSGVLAATPGILNIVSAGTTIDVYRDYAGTGWTNTGGKRASGGTTPYRIA